METIPYTRLNGHPTLRLPHNINISFEFIEGEAMLLNLDMKGICASSGSACTSGSLDPSHVLLAIGLPHEIAHGSLRLTLGRENSEQDVDYVLEVLQCIVNKLREISPLFAERKENLKMYNEKVMDHFSNPRNVEKFRMLTELEQLEIRYVVI